MVAQNIHFPPSMRRVYNHTRGLNVTIGSVDGWASRQGINRRSQSYVGSRYRMQRRSLVVCSYCSHKPSGDYRFYVSE
ncbi:hypothetical protein J1N35_004619 [Gossypium stocksii]|uniref:Uncharacterized protein n=1 Tax=Gossypium stocksii TaxID=47602 RepID=A0A9D4AHU8_9ROSI|nr:hypothetical protein J1N35_004619 [Gossypium stocksii]